MAILIRLVLVIDIIQHEGHSFIVKGRKVVQSN